MDEYIERLINNGKSARVKKMYFVYHIDTDLFLGRNKGYSYRWFLSEEPLQAFTINSLTQALYGNENYYGNQLSHYDWVLIEI